LANESSIYKPLKGGIHPREAAQYHSRNAIKVFSSAIEKSGLKLKDINVIAFSQGPGLGPCLRTGATFARTLSQVMNVPLVNVNHCIAHVEIGRLLCKCEDPVTLYVSGGNTMVLCFESGRYRVFGETLDIAIGNFLDTFSREAGLGLPGPPIIEEYAKKGEKILDFPYRVKGMDVSFSGLLTSALKYLKKGEKIEDICLSIIEISYSMLTEVTERALAQLDKKEVLLTGGVARSKRLREMLEEMVKEHNAKFFVVPNEFAGDNGAMIAWNGLLQYLNGKYISIEESFINPRMRPEEVEINWRK